MTIMTLRIQMAVFGGSASVRSMRGIVIEPETTLGICDGIVVPGGGWGNRSDAGAWGEVQRGDLGANVSSARSPRAGRRRARPTSGRVGSGAPDGMRTGRNS